MLPVWLTDTITTDLREAAHYTLLWGLEGMVIRSVGKNGQRVPHVNEAQIRHHLDEHKLLLPAVEPGLLECSSDDIALWKNQLATFSETLGFCTRVGVPRIVISAFTDGDKEKTPQRAVDALTEAAAKAERHGLQILVRNHRDHAHSSADDLLALVKRAKQPALGIAWDLSESQASGVDADSVVSDLLPHLGLMYVSGEAITEDDEWTNQVLEELFAGGFSGPVCLRFDPEQGTSGALRASTTFLRTLQQLRKSGTAGKTGR